MFFQEDFNPDFDITNDDKLELDGSFIPIPEGLRQGTLLENVVGTQFRLDDVFGQRLGLPEVIPIAGGESALRLQLDTFNPSAIMRGDSYFGTSIQTIDAFNLDDGSIAVEARVRVVDTNENPSSRGIIAALFFDQLGADPRDEIDFELLGNFIDDNKNSSSENNIFTNVFENDSRGERGDFSVVNLQDFSEFPDVDLTNFNTFRIEWAQDQVVWRVNGVRVRTETETIPDEAMNVLLNIWANGFEEAFGPSLLTASSNNENQTFFYDIDYLLVERSFVYVEFNADSEGLIEEGLRYDTNPTGESNEVTTQLTDDVLALGTGHWFSNG